MHVPDVGEQPFGVQQQIRVAVARVVLRVEIVEWFLTWPQFGYVERILHWLRFLEQGFADAGVADVGDAVLQGLAVENVAYRVRGVGLVLVLRESELHVQHLR